MVLSETQKIKIEEEEAYRAQVRGNLISERHPKNAKKNSWLLL